MQVVGFAARDHRSPQGRVGGPETARALLRLPSLRVSRTLDRRRQVIEPSESAEFARIRVDSRTDDPTRVDVSARDVVAFGPTKTGDTSTVEDALAGAIAQASAVGRCDIVAQLACELEARRLSAAGVRSLVDKRGRRPGQE